MGDQDQQNQGQGADEPGKQDLNKVPDSQLDNEPATPGDDSDKGTPDPAPGE